LICSCLDPISSFIVFFTRTETYHMIDKCDPEIATWSETGDNFVVKDLDKFAKVSTSWS